MKIALVRLSSFGDVVFTLPLARALREALGGPLAWVVEPPLASLLEGAPYVDAVLPAHTRAWRRAPFARATRREVAALVRRGREFAPDLVIDAQGLLKSALVTFALPAGRKVGFGWRTATERVNCLVTDVRVEARGRSHVVDRALALAEAVTGRTGWLRVPDVRHLVARPDAAVDAWLDARQGRPFVLLQPFSSRPAKEWSAGSTAGFCRRAREETGLEGVVRWGPGEEARAREIVELAAEAASLAPPSGPAATARLAAHAALFVGADTGPTHLAAAAGTPTVALFGPTDPGRFGPVGPRVAVLRDQGSLYNPRAAGLPGLSPDDVLTAALRLLVPD